nr:PDR/VanB family oxidoreductase [Sneathiella sp.]
MTNLIKVVIRHKKRESDTIMSYELRDADERPLPAFTAGSHIDVHLGKDLIRQYSLLNNPAETHRYVLGVLREETGRGGSKHLHDHLQEGDILTISSPRNAFSLDETASKTLLLAGGIGVTPLLSMAERLTHIGAQFEMHYCARTRSNTAFLEMMASAPYAQTVNTHFDDEATEQLLNIPGLLEHFEPGMHLYVCGPQGFMDAVIEEAQKNWPEEAIHREYFTPTPHQVSDGDRAFQVKIASTGEIIEVAADESIAAALKRQGIHLPLSCEQGICGTCITAVLGGIPDHRDDILSDEERAANDLITPCCSRSKSDLLILDL